MPAKKNKGINLLPQEEFEGSIVGRVLRWAMTTFRFIVIITEMIVMGAFLSRFWLDAQNSDLNETLGVRAAQITLQKDFETEFRNTQKRIDIFEQLSSQVKASDQLSKVVSKVPEGVSLQNFSYQDGSLQVKGVSVSEVEIAKFFANLKSETSFKDVSLGQVVSSESNQAFTVFTIKITY